jgi:hypothetical protein
MQHTHKLANVKLRRRYPRQVRTRQIVSSLIRKANEVADNEILDHQKDELLEVMLCTINHLDELRARLAASIVSLPKAKAVFDVDHFEAQHDIVGILLELDRRHNSLLEA